MRRDVSLHFRVAHWVAAAAATASLVAAACAEAYTAAPGWIAGDYATGFPHYPGDQGVGPVGLVFDPTANLLANDPSAGALYRIPPGGGSAAGKTVRAGYGQPTGLAWGADGGLYMARRDSGDVVRVDPADGHVVRTVAAGMPCPVGLATDPVSGDLFVANNFSPSGGIMRISG